MTNVNFHSMAKEIASLLDQKEIDETTRGDGKIDGSIWAKYSGTESAESITQANAEKVILCDLVANGVRYMQGVLHSIGIDWSPKGTSEADKLEGEIKAKQAEYAKKHRKQETSEDVDYLYNQDGKITGTYTIKKNADGTIENIWMDKFGVIKRKVIAYPDKEQSEVITNYDKDGKETYKEIAQYEGNYRVYKYFDNNGNLKLVAKVGEKQSFLKDANGNPIKDEASLETILDELQATVDDRFILKRYLR